MKLSKLILVTIISFLLLPGCCVGQRIINSKIIKKFPTDEDLMYPYATPSLSSEEVFLTHDPCLRMSDGSFVHIWEKSWSRNGSLEMTHYDLFLEELSSAEIILEREESIFYQEIEDTLVHLYTIEYDYRAHNYHARHRTLGLKSGNILETESIWLNDGRYANPVSFYTSPNGRFLMLSQPVGYRPGKRSYYMDDFIRSYEDLEAIHTRTGGISYMIFDLYAKEWYHRDTLRWGNKKKWVSIGAGIDDEGKIYTGIFDRKSRVTIYQDAKGETPTSLSYDELPDWRELLDPYSGFNLIKVGARGRVYLSLADRVKRGKLRGVKSFDIINFDFSKMEVDLRRKANISSGLKVQVGKVREDFGLKPNRRFEHYLVTEMVEMADESLWLVVQKYMLNTPNAVTVNFPRRGSFEEYAEEIILFEFDPDGTILKALVIPSLQRATQVIERTGYFYHMEVDREAKRMKLLTRESSGDKLRGPDRLYYREVDLEKGTYAPRKMVYEGERRDQYFIKAFTQWLNEDLLTTLIIEGNKGRAQLVSLNINQDPKKEEEK